MVATAAAASAACWSLDSQDLDRGVIVGGLDLKLCGLSKVCRRLRSLRIIKTSSCAIEDEVTLVRSGAVYTAGVVLLVMADLRL